MPNTLRPTPWISLVSSSSSGSNSSNNSSSSSGNSNSTSNGSSSTGTDIYHFSSMAQPPRICLWRLRLVPKLLRLASRPSRLVKREWILLLLLLLLVRIVVNLLYVVGIAVAHSMMLWHAWSRGTLVLRSSHSTSSRREGVG